MPSLRPVVGAAVLGLGRVLGLLLGLVLVLGPAGAGVAHAHPFGPPLTAAVTAHGSTVEVSWTGADDDWMALGDFTGAFPQNTDPARTGAAVLADSPQVRDYLLQHLAVSQQGQPCAATWQEVDRIVEEGARVVFACPDPVAVVDVQVSAMTDVNDAYRTVVTAAGGQVLFTAAQPVHQLDLTDAAAQDRTPVLVLSGAGAAVLLLGTGWALVSRRGPRSTHG